MNFIEIENPHLSKVFGFGGTVFSECDRLGCSVYFDVFARQYAGRTSE